MLLEAPEQEEGREGQWEETPCKYKHEQDTKKYCMWVNDQALEEDFPGSINLCDLG